jgi:hypothetical protein
VHYRAKGYRFLLPGGSVQIGKQQEATSKCGLQVWDRKAAMLNAQLSTLNVL